jgi:peptide/nickel transport system permease protein
MLMMRYLARRLLLMAAMMVALSIVCFAIIQLPPGDFLSARIAGMAGAGDTVDAANVERLRAQYGLDQPFIVQYWRWISGVVVGELGFSFELRMPVADVIGERLGISLTVEVLAIIVLWAIAIPVGIYSAVRQYSVGDIAATLFGFIGLAIPNFLLALLLMYVSYVAFGATIGGLFSPEYVDARWSLGRLLDFLGHVWAPVLVIATGGAAQIIRILRANLLDELSRPYVDTARAKGMAEWRLILRYPVRVAMNPLVSTVGWLLPTIISSSVVTGIVLNLPTLSPVLLRSLLSQDMHLAGALILLIGALTLLGTLLSDVLLAWLDPRIRLS